MYTDVRSEMIATANGQQIMTAPISPTDLDTSLSL